MMAGFCAVNLDFAGFVQCDAIISIIGVLTNQRTNDGDERRKRKPRLFCCD